MYITWGILYQGKKRFALSSQTRTPRVAVVSFPGTNTERETLMALRRCGLEPIEVLWNTPDDEVGQFDGYIIAGGFSYEDRSRAGIIASLDPIMNTIKNEAKKGKPVLGICNGAQVLVESGLVPGIEDERVGAALTNNKRTSGGHVLGTGYYNDWAHLKLSTKPENTAFTNAFSNESVAFIPFAHAEGRFLFPDGLLDELISNEQIAFRYCAQNGEVVDGFPVNPNGSTYNIAAITNPSGNVMAIMPHPERTENGDLIFQSMRNYILDEKDKQYRSLHFSAPQKSVYQYEKKPGSIELIVKMIITDNTAASVHNALEHLDIPVNISRFIHYEIEGDFPNPEAFIDKISKSDVLFNSNKEHLVDINLGSKENHFLIRPIEDLAGRQKMETLTQRFGFSNITKISKGVLWNVSSTSPNFPSVLDRLFATNILYNQYSHECFKY